jgi:hypothetical protein
MAFIIKYFKVYISIQVNTISRGTNNQRDVFRYLCTALSLIMIASQTRAYKSLSINYFSQSIILIYLFFCQVIIPQNNYYSIDLSNPLLVSYPLVALLLCWPVRLCKNPQTTLLIYCKSVISIRYKNKYM